jgi:hypothetical protein
MSGRSRTGTQGQASPASAHGDSARRPILNDDSEEDGMKLRTRSAASPERLERLAAARNQIQSSLGIKIDPERLDHDEQVALLELAHGCRAGAEPGVHRFNPQQLGRKERSRLEALVEKGAAKPGLFKRHREEATLKQRTAELATRARRPSARPRWEERGAVVLPRETAFEFLRDGIFFLEHFGLLVYLLAQFENGEALAPRSYFDGDTLVIDRNVGIGARFDPEGRMTPRWRETFDHLVANGWFTADTSGSGVRVTRGPRAIAATKGGSA